VNQKERKKIHRRVRLGARTVVDHTIVIIIVVVVVVELRSISLALNHSQTISALIELGFLFVN
jgi:hypothetical protein